MRLKRNVLFRSRKLVVEKTTSWFVELVFTGQRDYAYRIEYLFNAKIGTIGKTPQKIDDKGGMG